MIAHVTASITQKGGGIAYAVRDLVAALGPDAEVHSLADGGAVLEGASGVEHEVDYRFPIAQSKSLMSALASNESRLFHSHGLWSVASIAVPAAAQKMGTPWVISPHGMLDSWALQNSRWKKKLASLLFERNHLSGASCFHALCQEEADAIRAYGMKQPIAVIPNGVNLPEEVPLRGDREVRTLFFLGRLHPKKGLAELLRAWTEVKPAQWKLVIAGWDEGGHEAELRELAKDLPEVRFAGPAFGAEKEELFRAADAFILPSFSEGLPIAVLEAWSWGLPVMMTDDCHLPEGFEAQAAVRLSHDALAAGLAEGLGGDLPMMGLRGRQLVADRFSWERVAGEMSGVYQWLLAEGEKPSCVQ